MLNDEDAIARRLKPLLREALPDVDIDGIGPETTAEDVAGWDSVAHVTLVASVEEEFGIMFAPEEITGFSSVGELLSLIAKRSKETR